MTPSEKFHELYHLIRYIAPHDRLDLDDWVSQDPDPEDYTCGTIACIGGWVGVPAPAVQRTGAEVRRHTKMPCIEQQSV